MFDVFSESLIVAVFGLGSGFLLGLAARIGRFCTLGAIEDYFYSSSDLRLRMWGVAIGVAIIGTFGLIGIGWLDAGTPGYLARTWNPIASVVGGLVFGYGMAISGNCGFGALARLGGGDLRAFVIVLVTGISTYLALSGPLAPVRIWFFPLTSSEGVLPGIAHGFAAVTGINVVAIGFAAGILVLLVVIYPPHVRQSLATLVWGAIVGFAIVLGWAGTAWVARAGWEDLPIVSHTFSEPLGDTILYVMLSSGLNLNFGMGSVIGVLAGAFVGSMIKGHFRWEACDDPRELRRQMSGAVLMGIGAAISFGCSVGQGLSAMSLLAWSAPVTMLAILAGCYIGLRQLVVGFSPAE